MLQFIAQHPVMMFRFDDFHSITPFSNVTEKQIDGLLLDQSHQLCVCKESSVVNGSMSV